MARPRIEESEKLESINIRVKPQLSKRITQASQKLEISKSEVARLATDAGLTALERMSERSLVDYCDQRHKVHYRSK